MRNPRNHYGLMPPPHRRSRHRRIFYDIKFYALEIVATILFLFYLGKALWYELGL
jgi:hypothetical protein